MALPTTELTGTLKRIVEVCKDEENNFRLAIRYIKDSGLRLLFQSYAEQRAQFAMELQAVMARRGGQDTRSGTGTLDGPVHQQGTRIKSAAIGGGDKALVAECENGEGAAEEVYTEALKKTLPPEVKQLVQRQYMRIRESHDCIGGLGGWIKRRDDRAGNPQYFPRNSGTP